MRIYTSPWLYAKGREIDILATLEENYEKCPPLDQFLDTRLGASFYVIHYRAPGSSAKLNPLLRSVPNMARLAKIFILI